MINLLLCFSVVKNTKAILNIDVPKDLITSINGIRTLSITWVVLGHSLLSGVQYVGRYEAGKNLVEKLTFNEIIIEMISSRCFMILKYIFYF